MTNYSSDVHSCRVDFWKESGKWYDTIHVIFRDEDWKGKTLIHEAFRNALRDTVPTQYKGMRATCLEPYHMHSHPISLIWNGEK